MQNLDKVKTVRISIDVTVDIRTVMKNLKASYCRTKKKLGFNDFVEEYIGEYEGMDPLGGIVAAVILSEERNPLSVPGIGVVIESIRRRPRSRDWRD